MKSSPASESLAASETFDVLVPQRMVMKSILGVPIKAWALADRKVL